MKKLENEVRKVVIKVRMNEKELMLVKKKQHQTTERTLSEYIRSVSMERPVTVKYRNSSADDFLKDMLELKKELNAVGNNFNQAVKQLHILDKIPEFRFWVNHYDSMHKTLLIKVDEIKLKMNELYEQLQHVDCYEKNAV